jgi:hypothetical protein
LRVPDKATTPQRKLNTLERIVMDSSTVIKNLHKALKEMGHELPLGHMYEAAAKASGHKSYNNAKANAIGIDPVVQALSTSPQIIDASEKHTSEKRAINMAQDALVALEAYADRGLPAIYKSNKVMLADWFADLPWDQVGQTTAVNHLLQDDRAARIFKKVKDKLGLDMVAELKDALRNPEFEELLPVFEVKVVSKANEKVGMMGNHEIEIKKYYKVSARNEIEAKLIVDDYVKNRIEEEDDYKYDQSRKLAEIETAGDFWGNNWEVIWHSGTPQAKDVYGKPDSELRNRYFVNSKKDNSEAEVTFVNGTFRVHKKDKKELTYDSLEALYVDFNPQLPPEIKK